MLQNFQPHPQQLRVLRSRARWTVVMAGVRGGKTYSCAAAFLQRIFRDIHAGKVNDVPATGSRYRRPRYHAWVAAPTYDLLKEPRRYIESLIPPSMIEAFYEGRELWLRGGILIEFKSTDNAKALVSVGLQALWIDEADRVDADAWRGQLMTRLSDHQGWCLFSSTPYAARSGFLWQDFISRKDDPSADINFISWKFGDNPHNAASELRHAKATLPERYFKREYEASLDAFVGLVFELHDDRHIIDVLPDRKTFRNVVAGVDWGWNAPGAITVIADTGSQLIAVAEHVESHLQVMAPPGERTWLTVAQKLAKDWGVKQWLCDPSGPANINAFIRSGFNAVGAFNDISTGIRRIDELMMLGPERRSGFLIHRSCKELISEMRNLAWATDKNGAQKEEPAPGNDHSIDSLRYGVMELRRYPDTGVKPERIAAGRR